MYKAFRQFIQQNKLLQTNQTYLLAVSGGMDSVVLCELFSQHQLQFAIAHVNFGLRGDESNQDESFVTQLAARFHVPCFVKHVDTAAYAQQYGKSIQLAARELRYAWFEELRSTQGFYAICTAHHLNDSLETVLLNFSKGCGLAGLQGVPLVNGKIIRPLLFASKQQIEQFVKENQIEYREDSSNSSVKYQRNLIRHEVIPVLSKLNPSLETTYAVTKHLLNEASQLVELQLAKYKRQLIRHQNGRVSIALAQLKGIIAPTTVLHSLLKEYGFNTTQLNQLLQNSTSTEALVFNSATHQLVKDRKWIHITEIGRSDAFAYSVDELDTALDVAGNTLQLSFLANNTALDWNEIPKTTLYLSADELRFPMVLRNWNKGDYFYPFGMNRKKKKLSDFFTQLKLGPNEKTVVPVLLSGEAVIAVLPFRIDERYKITKHTKRLLKIEWKAGRKI